MDDSSNYSVMMANVRSWASNKMAMMSGPAPMDIGEVYSLRWTQDQHFAEEEWDEAEVQAVGAEHLVPSMQRLGAFGQGLRHQPREVQGKGQGYFGRELQRR